MQTFDLNKLLSENTYPGRGIVLGMDDKGENAVIAYFIMGRSVNSRNRIFVEKDGGIITKAFDESKMVDPSLIIYAPVRVRGEETIVTNGDQTDTVYDYLRKGMSFEDALRTRCFEPDAPNYTPRISGMVACDNGKMAYKLSILKSDNGDPEAPQRFFFDFTPKAGVGHFIHTYKCDGNPIPSFEGEPEKVALKGDIDAFTADVWHNLNEDNKVSLFVRYINIKTGETETRIVNKNV
ncbi:MAG: IMP cyclohydrolase [Clostridia bacterium]|nr:IMP cyclohydrolase [Clostridia bacterium]